MSARPEETTDKTEDGGNGPLDTAAGSVAALYHSRSFWRFLAILTGINLAVFLLLGIWVYCVTLGLGMLALRLPKINALAGKALASVTGSPAEKYLLARLEGPWWKWALQCWPLVFWLGISVGGLWLLLTHGFLAQNPLYLAFGR